MAARAATPSSMEHGQSGSSCRDLCHPLPRYYIDLQLFPSDEGGDARDDELEFYHVRGRSPHSSRVLLRLREEYLYWTGGARQACRLKAMLFNVWCGQRRKNDVRFTTKKKKNDIGRQHDRYVGLILRHRKGIDIYEALNRSNHIKRNFRDLFGMMNAFRHCHVTKRRRMSEKQNE